MCVCVCVCVCAYVCVYVCLRLHACSGCFSSGRQWHSTGPHIQDLACALTPAVETANIRVPGTRV